MKTLQIRVGIFEGCNLQCDYCDEKVKYKSMLKPTVLDIVKRLHEEYEFELVFDGAEPLMNSQYILEFLDYGKHITIFTNGTLITDELLEKLSPEKVKFKVSLDGPKELQDLHRTMPGGLGSFNRTMEGIRRLEKFGFSYDIGTTITNESIDYLPEIRKLYETLSPDRFTMTCQMFDRGEEDKTVAIYNKVKPIIDSWNSPKVSLHNLAERQPQVNDHHLSLEVYFNGISVEFHYSGWGTPQLCSNFVPTYNKVRRAINDFL